METDRSIDANTLDGFLDKARKRMSADKNRNFRAICVTTELPWEDFLNLFRGAFDVVEQGAFYELHASFEKHNKEFDVYVYLYRHPDTDSPIFLTLNSHDDFHRTADSIIRKTEGISYLWFPPESMAILRDNVLGEEGSRLVGFEGKKFGRERKYEEERRPGTRREGEYHADDAAETLEERKKEYSITPTHLYFEWPSKGDFHFRDEGEFVLTRGNPEFFFKHIVVTGLREATPLNLAIKASELHIIKNNGLQSIEKESLEIELTHPLQFEEVDNLVKGMKNDGFYPYSYQENEGSLLLNGRIVDEENGGMISMSTDGETITILPRYESGFDSLLRFYRFVVEEVDADATVAGVG